MIETRITKLLGIRYPILMGALHHISFAEPVAAVAEAGGIGFLPAASFRDEKALHREIRRARELTDGPIGLNISLVDAVDPKGLVFDFLEVGIDEGVRAIETAGRSPEALISRIKEANIPLIHKVPQVRFAKKVEDLGVDAVTLVGFEGGGYIGGGEVTTLILVNRASRELSIPVVAAGGIADGRGLVAALALGAEGVLLGTRFLASKETPLHENFKEWIKKASEYDTVVLLKSLNMSVRSIKNTSAEILVGMEERGEGMEEILAFASERMGREINQKGDVVGGLISAGEAVGLITDITGVGEIIADMVSEAEGVLERLNRLAAGSGKRGK
jgi:nitronate monooxygenase